MHCGPSGSMLGLCCVSNVPRREREEGDGKSEKYNLKWR